MDSVSGRAGTACNLDKEMLDVVRRDLSAAESLIEDLARRFAEGDPHAEAVHQLGALITDIVSRLAPLGEAIPGDVLEYLHRLQSRLQASAAAGESWMAQANLTLDDFGKKNRARHAYHPRPT